MEDDSESVRHTLSDGDCFGEMLISEHVSSFAYVTETPSYIYRLEEKLLGSLLGLDQFFSDRFFQVIYLMNAYIPACLYIISISMV